MQFSSLDKDGKRWIEQIEKVKLKFLKNLPYAKRGYAFKDYTLTYFFETKKWYKKNRNYKANPSDLSTSELKWREKVMVKKSIGDAEFF